MRTSGPTALLSISSLAVIAAFSSPAAACGASPMPYVTLGDALPAEGATEVSPDSVILVAAQGWYGGTPAEAAYALDDVVKFDLRPRVDDDSALHGLPGTIVPWIGSAVFVPAAPLAPNTTYDLIATVVNQTSSEEGDPQAGTTTTVSSFTTGTTRLASLAFGGQPTIGFADLEHEVCETQEFGGCGTCLARGMRSDRTVVVDLPAPVGGDPLGGFSYYATAHLSEEDRGEDGFVVGLSSIPTRTTSRLTVPLFAEPKPYGVCVDIELHDARGTTVSSEQQCFPKETVWASLAAPEGTLENGAPGKNTVGADPAPDDRVALPADSGTGCAVGGAMTAAGARTTSWGVLALVGLVTGFVGARRGRRPRGPGA
jgi:hypothetical protein